jgi:hypothetical protein
VLRLSMAETEESRTAAEKEPVATFPGHWAPNAPFSHRAQLAGALRGAFYRPRFGIVRRSPPAGTTVFQPLNAAGKATAHEILRRILHGDDGATEPSSHRLAQGPTAPLHYGRQWRRILKTGNNVAPTPWCHSSCNEGAFHER